MLNFGLRKKIVKLKHFVKEHIQKKDYIVLTPDKQNRTKVLQKVARRLFWNYPRTVVWLKAGGGSYGKHGSFYYNSCSDKNVQSTLKYFISEYYMLVNTNAGSQFMFL